MCKKLALVELELELLGLLPGEVLVGEVAVLSGLEVDGVDEVKLLDDDTGAEVEVVLDNLESSSEDLSEVPYVSTKRERGSATPMA